MPLLVDEVQLGAHDQDGRLRCPHEFLHVEPDVPVGAGRVRGEASQRGGWRWGQGTATRLVRVLALLVNDLVQPIEQLLLWFSIGEVVHQDDSMDARVEDAAGVLVAQRSADIEELHEIGALAGSALLELVDPHLDVAAHRPARSDQRLIVGDQVR